MHWRWSEALNPEAIEFSVIVALAETMTYVGTCIFFFDIWDEKDRRISPKNQKVRSEVSVDILIATLDEDADILEPSIDAALSVSRPNGVTARIWLLDDGSRDEIERLRDHNDVAGVLLGDKGTLRIMQFLKRIGSRQYGLDLFAFNIAHEVWHNFAIDHG